MYEVVLTRKQREAEGIFSFRLERPDGGALPAFEAGAHIDVTIDTTDEGPPGGAPGRQLIRQLIRQYSLCNPPRAGAADHYLIGVLDDPASRGGSRTLCRQLEEGRRLRISAPRNLFALAPEPAPALLVAGGIGITPILAMAEALAAAGRDYRLHYCARRRSQAAFLSRLAAPPHAARSQLHFDDEQPFDAAAALAGAPAGAHLYVCGPAGFMDHLATTALALGWDANRLHREHFGAAPATTPAGDQPFEIEIASTGARIPVAADESVTQALARAGIDIPTSCEQGVCGTCLTRVLAGQPDHRDQFLTAEERAAADHFLPCCSRAQGPLLKLDL